MTTWVTVPRRERDGRCSDNECPCPAPGRRIPRGTGFLYISPDFVEFRSDCLDPESLGRKLESLQRGMDDTVVVVDPELYKPLLACREGASRRKLVLPVAGRDALHWWRTGLVPLRATPTRSKGWQIWKQDPTVPPPDEETRAWQSRVAKLRHSNTERVERSTMLVGRGMECLLQSFAESDLDEKEELRRFAYGSCFAVAARSLGELATDASLDVRGWDAAETLVGLADELTAVTDPEASATGENLRSLLQGRLGL